MRVPEHPPSRRLPSRGQSPRPPHTSLASCKPRPGRVPCLLLTWCLRASPSPAVPGHDPGGTHPHGPCLPRQTLPRPPASPPCPALLSLCPRGPEVSPPLPCLMLRRGSTPPCPLRASAAAGSARGRGVLQAGAFACPHPALRGHGRRGDC